MGVQSSLGVHMALGGSFRQAVSDDAPLLWYRFADQLGSTTTRDDSSTSAYTGTFVGGCTLEQSPYAPDGGYGVAFNGSTGYVTIGGSPGASGSTLTIEAVLLLNSPAAEGVIVGDSGGSVWFSVTAARKLNMRFGGSDHLSTTTIADQTDVHVMVSISAGSGTFYVNGTSAGTFSGFSSLTPARVGAHSAGSLPFKGTIDEVAIYLSALSSTRASVHSGASKWTDVSGDIEASDGFTAKFGIAGNGPRDRVPDVGVCSFSLNNGVSNSGGKDGYYSPNHANCRTGFTFGVLLRVMFTYSGMQYQRWTGKIRTIDPDPGIYGRKWTKVQAEDLVSDLLAADVRNVTVQTSANEASLLQSLIFALPVTARPLALKIDAGLDTSPYAFDDLDGGASALAVAGAIVRSSIGYLHIDGRGVLRYENRQQRQLASSAITFDNSMVGFVGPSSLENVYNHVRAAYTPRAIDASATTVLYSNRGNSIPVDPGSTITIWADYYDPNNPDSSIGGTSFASLTASTDYLANAAADGSGADKTAQVAITGSPFSTTAKFVITNNDAAQVFITKLQLRGKGLYKYSPIVVESQSTKQYGDRAIDLDMPYQSDYNTALGLAQYVRAQFESLTNQTQQLIFIASDTAALMLAALTFSIGTRITVSEGMTGTALADVFIQGFEYEVTIGPWIICRLSLSSATYFSTVWVMDDAAKSLADSTTVFGYA